MIDVSRCDKPFKMFTQVGSWSENEVPIYFSVIQIGLYIYDYAVSFYQCAEL